MNTGRACAPARVGITAPPINIIKVNFVRSGFKSIVLNNNKYVIIKSHTHSHRFRLD